MSPPRPSSPNPAPEDPPSPEIEKEKEKEKEKGPPLLTQRCADLPPLGDPIKQQELVDELRRKCRQLEEARDKANSFQTQVMSFHLGRTGIVWLLLYMAVFGVTTTYTLLSIWPADIVEESSDTTNANPTLDNGSSSTAPTPVSCKVADPCADTVVVFRANQSLPLGIGRWFPGVTLDFRPPYAGRRLLLIALLAGGLGAFISSVLSLATYVGNRELTRSWGIWYLVRPPAGMALALLTYFLLRGGLLTTAAGASEVSPYGVAAMSGLIGMFVRQALDKLRDIAETAFASRVNEERKEQVHEAPEKKTPPSPPAPPSGGTQPPSGGAAPPAPPAAPGGAPEAPTPEAIARAHEPDTGA